jgi:hypothetical protein
MAVVAAASCGWRVLYLGPDVPGGDLVQAVKLAAGTSTGSR